MNSNNRSSSISSLLDKSMRSIKTNSTVETTRKDNIREILNLDTLDLNSISTRGRLPSESNCLSSKNASRRTYKSGLKKYLPTEQTKEDLINNADLIMNERKKQFILPNQLVKSVFMKRTNEICLDNYKINLMSKRRKELNERVSIINRAIKSTEKIFDQDYKIFFEFVEETNNSYKRQEDLLNKYKKLIEQKEKEYNKQSLENKKLKEDLEYMVRKILTLRYYGSFIHNVFKTEFIYEGIKRTEGKSYIAVAEDIMKTYEKNEGKGYDEEKLLDEYWLMAQINEFELNIISIVKERELIKKEIMKSELEHEEEIERLKKQIKDEEEELEYVKQEKDKFVHSITTYNTPEIMDTVLECIQDLTEHLGLNSIAINILLKDKTPMSYTGICSTLMKNIKEKENIVINHIEDIEKIINGEIKEDKEMIEEIISERRKEVKKRKLFELLKHQKDLEMKKNMKAVERINRIVIKGRKVIEFPTLKPKKKKKKTIVKENDDEIIYYSSEEN